MILPLDTQSDDRIEHLLDVLLELAAGNLAARVAPSRSDDELAAVESALNQLAARLQENSGQLEQRLRERNEALRGMETEEGVRLRRQLLFTRFAVDHVADPIYWVDQELRFIYVNEAMCECLGYSREELLGRHAPEVDADWPEMSPKVLFRLKREKGQTTRLSRYRRRDGSLLPVEITSKYVEYEGEPYLCAVARDDTERRRAEETLRMRETNLKALTESASDGIAVISDAGFAFVNRRLAELGGYMEQELASMDPWQLLSADQREIVRQRYLQRKQGAEVPSRYETHVLHRDGSTVPIEINASRVIWDGKPATLAIVRDTTQRKRFEKQLRQQTRMLAEHSEHLERVNDELQHFLYVTSHDLKAPLRAVSQLTSVLTAELSDKLEPEPRRLLKLLRGRVQRMHNLLEALLTYAAAGQEGESTQVDTGLLVRELLATYPVPDTFHIELAVDMPVLCANPLHLRQVFANLIANAIEHHDRTEGHIWIGAEDTGAAYLFSVRDDGPGIAAGYREKVFEIFQTLETRDRSEHTGIGLPLAQKLVLRAGGTLSLHPTPSRGSEFRFTWPKEPVRGA